MIIRNSSKSDNLQLDDSLLMLARYNKEAPDLPVEEYYSSFSDVIMKQGFIEGFFHLVIFIDQNKHRAEPIAKFLQPCQETLFQASQVCFLAYRKEQNFTKILYKNMLQCFDSGIFNRVFSLSQSLTLWSLFQEVAHAHIQDKDITAIQATFVSEIQSNTAEYAKYMEEQVKLSEKAYRVGSFIDVEGKRSCDWVKALSYYAREINNLSLLEYADFVQEGRFENVSIDIICQLLEGNLLNVQEDEHQYSFFAFLIYCIASVFLSPKSLSDNFSELSQHFERNRVYEQIRIHYVSVMLSNMQDVSPAIESELKNLMKSPKIFFAKQRHINNLQKGKRKLATLQELQCKNKII